MIALLLPLRNNLDQAVAVPYEDAPEERALCVGADLRTLAVAELRTVAIEADPRALDVGSELRRLAVEAELRRMS